MSTYRPSSIPLNQLLSPAIAFTLLHYTPPDRVRRLFSADPAEGSASSPCREPQRREVTCWPGLGFE